MKKIIAIAGLTLKNAVRSRVVLVLIAFVFIGVIGLPLIIKSDGTIAGKVQLLLQYALGLTVFILSVAAVWAGAGAISLEMQGGQIHMLVTKPVNSLQIWLGKWLGLVVLNLLLLCLAGMMIYGMLCWSTRASALNVQERVQLREELLVARRLIKAESPAFDDLARRRLEEVLRQGSVPADVPRDRLLARIKSQLQREQAMVAPGQSRRWRFFWPEGMSRARVIFVQFRFATSRVEQIIPVACTWLIGTERNPAQYRIETRAAPNAKHQFKLPSIDHAADDPLVIEFINAQLKPPATVLFRDGLAPELLVAAGSFEMNFIRALLLTLARLAFFSALGLTIGAFFSFPVAVFVSLALLLITLCDSLIAGMASQSLALAGIPATALGWHSFFHAVFIVLNVILPPISRFEALSALADGRLVPWDSVLKGFGFLVGIYCSCFALMGAWLFSRRETGLADSG